MTAQACTCKGRHDGKPNEKNRSEGPDCDLDGWTEFKGACRLGATGRDLLDAGYAFADPSLSLPEMGRFVGEWLKAEPDRSARCCLGPVQDAVEQVV